MAAEDVVSCLLYEHSVDREDMKAHLNEDILDVIVNILVKNISHLILYCYHFINNAIIIFMLCIIIIITFCIIISCRTI